jgi:hypothetical protein
MRTGSRSLNIHRGLAAAAALTIAGWGAMSLPAAAQPKDNGDPGGNNGTVKIVEGDGTAPCVVNIAWYGFDEGTDIVSTVEFEMQAPTRTASLSATGPSQVFVGGDPASGAGTDSGFDGEATYALAIAGEPDPQQGYHVKVTVHTPRSLGADTKSKVFWVQPPCEGPPGPPA